MRCPPPANPFDVAGAFEVIGVGRLAPPPGLALLLAYPPALGRRTKTLAPLIARIRNEGDVAMQTLEVRRRTGHRPEEDALHVPDPTRTPSPNPLEGEEQNNRKKTPYTFRTQPDRKSVV